MALPNIIQQINSKLPLSGGTITGNLVIKGSICACKEKENNGYLLIGAGSTWNDASSLILYSHTYTDNSSWCGSFALRSISSDKVIKDLIGRPDGTLTWCGNDVITSAGGTMKGILNIPSNGIRGNKIDGCIHIYAGTDYSNGAILRLCGNSEANSGEFSLWAGGNSSGSKQLHGYPNGNLTWAGSKVLTDADKTTITLWGLPNYNGIISGIGSTYTAPHNGFVSFNKSGTSNATVNGITVYLGGNDAYNEGNVTLYLKKGDTISVAHDSGTMCFVPLYCGG
jgi:hypothetical protein